MTHSASEAWSLVRAAAAATRDTERISNGDYAYDGQTLVQARPGGGAPVLTYHDHYGWRSLLLASDVRHACLDLYLPLLRRHAAAPFLVAQLGQSIDGFIATANGQSQFVTGEMSIVHLHRLRALSDCVIVGAGTVAADNPRLTTRLVSGANPVRVVLDPHVRLPLANHVFSDGQASTLRVRAHGVRLPARQASSAVEEIEIAAPSDQLDLKALLSELGSRGLRSVLVEGGGVTVSSFFAAGLLDRLHIVVAPFVMGEGRPGLRVPGAAQLQDCARPPPRVFTLGGDVLFDCDLRNACVAGNSPDLMRRVL